MRLTWRDDAACLVVEDISIFHPRSWQVEADVASAKAVCRECPVNVECLRYALTSGQDMGIWGGQTPAERHRLQRRRR